LLQIEQLHSMTFSSLPSASKAIFPQ